MVTSYEPITKENPSRSNYTAGREMKSREYGYFVIVEKEFFNELYQEIDEIMKPFDDLNSTHRDQARDRVQDNILWWIQDTVRGNRRQYNLDGVITWGFCKDINERVMALFLIKKDIRKPMPSKEHFLTDQVKKWVKERTLSCAVRQVNEVMGEIGTGTFITAFVDNIIHRDWDPLTKRSEEQKTLERDVKNLETIICTYLPSKGNLWDRYQDTLGNCALFERDEDYKRGFLDGVGFKSMVQAWSGEVGGAVCQ